MPGRGWRRLVAVASGALVLGGTMVGASGLVAAASAATSRTGTPAASQRVPAKVSRVPMKVRTVNLSAAAANHAVTHVPTYRQGAAAGTPGGLPAAGAVTTGRRLVKLGRMARKGAATAPKAADSAVTSRQVPNENGFVGLTGPEQATANGGIDLEPPDQGLCAGEGLVGEFINNAFTVYNRYGMQQEATIPSYKIFGQPSKDFFSDPRCYYDASTQRWILTEFIVGTTNAAGKETSPSVQYVAISNDFDPLGSYIVYSFNTTDASHKGCPCFGDFDQLGVDNYGIYLSTNEFGISSGAYNGVIIYAFSKQLAETEPTTGILPTLFRYRVPTDYFGQTYHIAPAQSPPGAKFAPNTEYFVESNGDALSDTHLAVYAMYNTSTLATPAPPSIFRTKISSERYTQPPDATQKAGMIPLGKANSDPEGQLQADFDAIQEVTYTGGKLYAEADTAFSGAGDGAAWFVIKPTFTGTALSATMAHQGYVRVAGTNSLIYPDIAVNAHGDGYLVFSLSGPRYYPSAAYQAFTPSGPTGPVRIAAAGADPEDSFTCYAAFVGPFYGGCRWGDYSMGVAMGTRVYLATEMIPNSSRDYLTNWGTFVWSAPAP